MSALRGLLGRLAKPPEEIRAEHLREWASSIPGAVALADMEPRQRARVAGVVRNIRIDPREGQGFIEATVTDGTGTLVARWLGRSSLSGVKLGVGLVMEGIAAAGDDDELVILNPEYELILAPEHG
ncbi:MAG: DNA-binding protein [Actinomycetota bacterium]